MVDVADPFVLRGLVDQAEVAGAEEAGGEVLRGRGEVAGVLLVAEVADGGLERGGGEGVGAAEDGFAGVGERGAGGALGGGVD